MNTGCSQVEKGHHDFFTLLSEDIWSNVLHRLNPSELAVLRCAGAGHFKHQFAMAKHAKASHAVADSTS